MEIVNELKRCAGRYVNVGQFLRYVGSCNARKADQFFANLKREPEREVFRRILGWIDKRRGKTAMIHLRVHNENKELCIILA